MSNSKYSTDLEVNRCILVHGSAGTGKTIIAQTFAKRLADKGASVLLLFYNRGIAKRARYAFDKNGKVTVSTFASFAKRQIEREDSDWWEAQTHKGNEFWHTELPMRLFELSRDRLPRFDAVIVDEGQDFKPEWYQFLQQLLTPGKESHYVVLLDEKQDIFGHWKEFPCQPIPARKVLTKNCRNTRTIVDFLNRSFPTGMSSFDRSPVGAQVIVRRVSDEGDELKQITTDVHHLTTKEKISAGAIVILVTPSKEESFLRNVTKIDRFELASTYELYDSNSNKLHYSTIEVFKGLEADVVLLSLRNVEPSKIPQALYVQGSRAKHLLYIYRPDTAA